MKQCLHCGKDTGDNKKSYCNKNCISLKKYKERFDHQPKQMYKRNKGYFYMCTGFSYSINETGQGGRSGSMVKGSMSANIQLQRGEWVLFNKENVKLHFDTCNKIHCSSSISFGDKSYASSKEIENILFNPHKITKTYNKQA